MNWKFKALGFAAGMALLGTAALAGGYYPGFPSANLPITGSEHWAADTNLAGGAQPQTEDLTTAQISGFIQGQAGSGGWRNSLIGGDFYTNLWQRGTTGASTTTALLYGPDRWWGLSGTGTAFTQRQDAITALPGALASDKVWRTAGQTGIIPVCIGQVLTTANSAKFQNRKAEFRFSAISGGNFSAASGQITATIGYGTGTDDTAANFAAGSWAGQVNVSQLINIYSSWDNYSVVTTVPAAATQVGVQICFTPVGTAGTNDFFSIANAQLSVNQNAVAKTDSPANNSAYVANYQVSSFEHRLASLEALLQEAYFYRIVETNGAYLAAGDVSATNVEVGVLPLPVTMRAVPTCTFTAGGLKWNLAGTNTAVGTLTCNAASTPSILTLGDTVTATAGGTAFLNGSATTGRINISAEL